MSGQLAPVPPPQIVVQMKYESFHIEQMIRGVSHYNQLLLEAGEPPLHPSHPLIKLQSVLIQQMETLIAEGVKNGWSIGHLLTLKQEISDMIEEATGGDTVSE